MSPLTAALTTGYITSLQLILAIGAQNAFVLRQGLRGEYVLPVVLVCALSDAVLILVGVSSFATIERIFPGLAPAFKLGGAVFLIWYGVTRLRAAWRGGEVLRPDGAEVARLGPILLTCLALTWLNPHVYLDTVILLGSLSTGFGEDRWWFGVGGALASLTFFASLGYGARLLRPIFARPSAWRALDVVIAVVMFVLAGLLLWG